MAYEQKPSDIAIFREKSPKSDKAPTWKGTLITPSGEKLSIALWDKGNSGTMLAGKVETPREQSKDDGFRSRSDERVADRGASHPFDDIDEVPF